MKNVCTNLAAKRRSLKYLRRRKWQPTPVFLPGKSHGQGSLAGYCSWCRKRVRHDWATKQQQRSTFRRTSLAIQCLRCCMPNTEGTGSIPGPRTKIPHAAWYSLKKKKVWNILWASLVAKLVKKPPAMQETGFNPWVGKLPWRRNGYPLQYSGVENSMDYRVHGVEKSWTGLSDFHFHFFHTSCIRTL